MYLTQVAMYPVLKLKLVLGLSTLKYVRGPAPSETMGRARVELLVVESPVKDLRTLAVVQEILRHARTVEEERCFSLG